MYTSSMQNWLLLSALLNTNSVWKFLQYLYRSILFLGHCLPCECNGHADLSQQSCDSLTGICYCVDNTHGDHCEMCDQGYYGDPR